MSLKIIHVSECPTSLNSGMGRIQYNWNNEIRARGHDLTLIEPGQIGPLRHPLFFPMKAKGFLKNSGIKPDVIISHEPASGAFVGKGVPVYLVSHGIEARYWELSLQGKIPNPNVASLKTRILFPLWRLAVCNKGLRKSHKLLLSNEEDANYAQLRFGRRADDIKIFKNGFNINPIDVLQDSNRELPTILWNASWLERKGKDVLIGALNILKSKEIKYKIIIAGTGYPESMVLEELVKDLTLSASVISKFKSEEEVSLLSSADIFVLPSYFEGLPLSLIQAMASGLCCVVSDNCGQRDVIKHNVTGLKFETGNSQDLASQLERIIIDVNLRRKIGIAGKNASALWDWKTVSADVVNFIENNA